MLLVYDEYGHFEGIVTPADVQAALERMAAIVDRQNQADPRYRPMAPRFTDSITFQAAEFSRDIQDLARSMRDDVGFTVAQSAVTALGWDARGGRLAFGCQDGQGGILTLSG